MKAQLEEKPAEAPAIAALGDDLLGRIEKLEEYSAQHAHSIAPEVIESIMQQAAKRSVQEVAALLRKVADLLEVLEK